MATVNKLTCSHQCENTKEFLELKVLVAFLLPVFCLLRLLTLISRSHSGVRPFLLTYCERKPLPEEIKDSTRYLFISKLAVDYLEY